MELRFNLSGKERKPLIEALSDLLGQDAKYNGAPTYGYNIGEYHVDRDGTVTGEFSLSLIVGLAERGFEAEKSETFHLITPRGTLLIQGRFNTEEQARQAGYDMYFTHKGLDIYTKRGESEPSTIFAMVGEMFEAIDIPAAEAPDTTPEVAETAVDAIIDRLAIEYPLDGFTPGSRINLEKLVNSKAVLLKQALGIDELPIEETDKTLRFAWFPADSDGDTVNAYAQFITALCDTAKKKSRVVAKAQDSFENPRFTMRVWLIGLGLVGKEYDLCRKQLMAALPGNSGFRYGKPEEGAVSRKRDGIHREVISIRLMPDTLEKLTVLAGQYTTPMSRNQLIEMAVEKFLAEEAVEPSVEPESTERTEFTPEGE